MITVICVYNNRVLLEDRLLKSLKNQSNEYELILLDNTNGKYDSAARALNCGAKQATTDYLMFVHQDVDLLYDDCLKDIEEILINLNDLGVAGVAGYTETNGKFIMYSNIKDGRPPEDVGVYLNDPLKVQTVDECLFIVPRSMFEKLKFDEITCPGWHLYGVDYCLSTNKFGKSVYVVPINIYHVSRTESFSKDYYNLLKNIVKKHGQNYKTIDTSCGIWNTNSVRLDLNILEDKILRFLKLR
jgi:hypothetical protein